MNARELFLLVSRYEELRSARSNFMAYSHKKDGGLSPPTPLDVTTVHKCNHLFEQHGYSLQPLLIAEVIPHL